MCFTPRNSMLLENLKKVFCISCFEKVTCTLLEAQVRRVRDNWAQEKLHEENSYCQKNKNPFFQNNPILELLISFIKFYIPSSNLNLKFNPLHFE